MKISCFKAYDVRGRVPDQLNEDVAYRIGRAYAQYLAAKRVAVGYDIRLTSKTLCNALTEGLTDGGADVINIGECGTEQIYFAAKELDVDGGIVVTASHNPMDYNGMKFVREDAKPISGDTGLFDIQALAEAGNFAEVTHKGSVESFNHSDAYIKHLLTYVDVAQLKLLKVVVNAGNGGAGAVVDLLEQHLPFEFIKVHHEANGNFPNGVPNPLLEENRQPTVDAVIAHNADLGLAWDGDFDRCFFFDSSGRFIEGYYVVGLLAEAFLVKQPGSKIVHDPRLTWNTIEVAERYDGKAIMSKTGHAFIKECMRHEDAIYGGEMSAHHYFRDFAYCDSGMIPWLLITALMSQRNVSLASLVDECMLAYPCSGEINTKLEDPEAAIAQIESQYSGLATALDRTDGLSMSFGNDWRFNLRMSNTEPVLRLNVESKADSALMEAKRDELLAIITSA
jgi:phosphomannomutase